MEYVIVREDLKAETLEIAMKLFLCEKLLQSTIKDQLYVKSKKDENKKGGKKKKGKQGYFQG